jgi:hypothetical protein
MSIKVSNGGSLSPKDQFDFDKRNLFNTGSVTLGAGASVTGGATAGYSLAVRAPTTEIGYASVVVSPPPLTNRGAMQYNGIDWSKSVTFGFRAVRRTTAVDANSEFKIFLGKSYNVTGGGNRLEPVATDRAVGFKQVGTGAFQFMCSNGFEVSTTSTSFTPVRDQAYDVIFEVSGGTARMFINDVLVGTNTTAPFNGVSTGETQLMALWITAENTAVITASPHSSLVNNYFLSCI